MSNILFKEISYNLDKLLAEIKSGEIGLPDIQRPFKWRNPKVRDLFDSMYRGFPVGYLLFWANGVPNGHRQIGTDAKQRVPRLLIVDGQQRLTSLYAVIKGIEVVREDYRKERIFIAFSPKDEVLKVADAAVRNDAEFIPDISILWQGKRETTVKGYLDRLRARRPVDQDEEDGLREAIDRLYDLGNYPFRVLELSADVSEEDVAEVFVRINSMGVTLNQADFILTLMSVFWDQGRADLETFCRRSREPATGASPFNYFIQPDPDQLLRVGVGLGFRRARLEHVYSILRGKDMETGEFSDKRRDKQFAVLREAQAYTLDLQNWQDFLKVPLRAGFRSAAMITSQIGLLYTYGLFLIGKRDFGVDDFTLRNVLARWFFMTALTGRYTDSPESSMDQDLGQLRDVRDAGGFVALLDSVVRDTLTDDYWDITLPNLLGTSAPRSPSLFAYYAALNLLEARVLFSKMKVSELLDPASKASRAALERHHLFPRGYLAKIGIADTRDVNQIANFALLEWPDNNDIGDQAPAKYYPRYAGRLSKEARYWHALPKSWEQMPYQNFLGARRKGMARVIRDGFAQLWR